MAFLTILFTVVLTCSSASTSSPASATTFLTAFFTVASKGCNSLASTLIARTTCFLGTSGSSFYMGAVCGRIRGTPIRFKTLVQLFDDLFFADDQAYFAKRV